MAEMFPSIFYEHRSIFHEFCRENDLRLLVDGIDRHGSLLWEAGKYFDGLNHIVSLAFTAEYPDPSYSRPAPAEGVLGHLINRQAHHEEESAHEPLSPIYRGEV